jgi:DNA-binding response OmpR family regulator
MKKKILIVDDEKDMVDIVAIRLEAAGYEWISAFDGEEGLDKARRERPDLIVLDLMLPKLDGYKVCRMLKSDEKYRDIPIILFTAQAQKKDSDAGKEAGSDAYIVKPFEPQVLIDKIGELLSRQGRNRHV